MKLSNGIELTYDQMKEACDEIKRRETASQEQSTLSKVSRPKEPQDMSLDELQHQIRTLKQVISGFTKLGLPIEEKREELQRYKDELDKR